MALAIVHLSKINDEKQRNDLPMQIPQVMPISDLEAG